jgi:hypothetical protein
MLSKILKWSLVGSAILAGTIASSWLGAITYVKTFPQIIEYIAPITIRDMEGDVVTSGRPGDGIVFHTSVRRQPYDCWGSYTYRLAKDDVAYQFPMLRSYDLSRDVQITSLKHLFVLPPKMPAGTYEWSVVIFPTCQGVDLPPTSIDLKTNFTILK